MWTLSAFFRLRNAISNSCQCIYIKWTRPHRREPTGAGAPFLTTAIIMRRYVASLLPHEPAATDVPPASVTPGHLKVKRVDCYWSTKIDSWKYKKTHSGVAAETVLPKANRHGKDPWAKCCFVVVRKIATKQEGVAVTFRVVVKSPYLLQACIDVIGAIPGMPWTTEPLEVFSTLPILSTRFDLTATFPPSSYSWIPTS